MKHLFTTLLVCAVTTSLFGQPKGRSFNKALADSLARMRVVDQEAAYIRVGKYKDYTDEAWSRFKDSVFTTHQVILENIFNQYGYPGYDLVGQEGSNDFWLMVQHSDHNPVFQERILKAMEPEVKRNNANPKNYAYLIDRVHLNTGRKQLYGTQVTYRQDICQAMPKPLEDSLNVNARRKAVGLPSIEEYLNMMTTGHFEMNKASMESRGITKPTLYALPKDY